jgi:lipopolysaccharide/colanic/teichoic acid biosynthesis glycosyltransferase
MQRDNGVEESNRSKLSVDPGDLELSRTPMRRIVDVLFSVAFLLACAPLLAVIALAVLIDSSGPVMYLALRSGKDGKIFRMWKFRTMVIGADRAGPITGRNDPRITRIGALLRKTKLDELPQFFNVLFGDMTLVGPRPETPGIVALYTPVQRAVLGVKPGVTGRVQLEAGEESDSIPEGVHPQQYYLDHLLSPKLSMDLAYLEVRTVWSDIGILSETVAYVFGCLLGRSRPPHPKRIRQAVN